MKHRTTLGAPALALILTLLPPGSAWAQAFNSVSSTSSGASPAQAFNSVSSSGTPPPATGPAPAAAPATIGAARAPAGNFDVADKVVVAKGERRLYLLRENRVIAEYPVHLGLNPYGPKQREGDFRTPEGSYRLVRRNPRSGYFLSIQVSYPSDDDLRRAEQQGARPGGLIMIHGEPNVLRKPAEYYARNDWTDGCIAVSNADMVDIWLRTDAGIPIEIRP
jgi:murein L,D-transpeptidase YafK